MLIECSVCGKEHRRRDNTLRHASHKDNTESDSEVLENEEKGTYEGDDPL